MTRSTQRWALASTLTAWLLQAGSVSALGLIQAYDAALKNDPAYRSAVYENEAGKLNKTVGLSNLLPSLSANYAPGKNWSSISSPDALGQSVTVQRNYNSKSSSVQLRQALFNLDGIARYRQGIAQADYSDAQFASRRQDLILRLVSAYSEAKYAEDSQALAIAQRDAYAEQRSANVRMFEKGEGTKTDVLETQAKYDLAEAGVIEAKDKLTDARNALAAIVGQEITALDPLRDDFRVKPVQPSSFEEWKAIALEHNPDIIAQRHVVEASLQEVKKNRAGHAPRLDLTASYSDNRSDTIYTIQNTYKTTSVGLQLNIPIYSGGYVSATTSQAVSNYEKAKADLDTKTSQILVDLRKNFNQSVSSVLRIEALLKSVSSASLLVDATQKSVKGGLRTNFDVLNAQQQLFTAKRDLSLARYNYLLGYLRLRQAAGIVDANELQTIAGYFVANSQ